MIAQKTFAIALLESISEPAQRNGFFLGFDENHQAQGQVPPVIHSDILEPQGVIIQLQACRLIHA